MSDQNPCQDCNEPNGGCCQRLPEVQKELEQAQREAMGYQESLDIAFRRMDEILLAVAGGSPEAMQDLKRIDPDTVIKRIQDLFSADAQAAAMRTAIQNVLPYLAAHNAVPKDLVDSIEAPAGRALEERLRLLEKVGDAAIDYWNAAPATPASEERAVLRDAIAASNKWERAA